MAEDAEKKNIARLNFSIDDAINSLDLVNKKLEEIAKTSEKFSKDISKNINTGISININSSELEKNFVNIENMTKNSRERLTLNAIKEEQKHQNTMSEIAAKGETTRQNYAYKTALQQEKYNERIANSAESLYDKIAKYAETYVIYQGINKIKNEIPELIDEMVKVEQQMVSIDRVMNVQGMNIDAFRDKLIQLAYDYGNSFDNVADVSLRLAQAGIKGNNNLALTEKTLLALNTAELNATQATDDMVAVMSQWNLITDDATQTADDYGKIIDKVNKVADNFPTTSEDILDALKKTSSAFNLAGASIDETIATIVAAEKASQRGGKVIGTALSNITQQLKEDKKLDLAESLGISFFKDEAKTEFKPIMEIFQSLSEKMQQLKDEGKESSVEMQKLLGVFTVFRRNIGSSLLGEMAGEDSTYAKVLKTTTDAVGYSMDENAKYMKTAKAAQEQFNATLLQLKTEVWDGKVENVYRDLLNSGTNFVEWLQKLSKEMKLLPAVIGIVTAGFSLLGKKIDYNSLKKYSSSLKEMKTALELYNDTVGKGEITSKEFNKVMGDSIPNSVKKYTTGLGDAKASMAGLVTNTVLQTAKQLALNLAVAAGEAAISFGLSLAIQGIVTLIGNWIHSTENATKAVGEMNNKISESSDDLDTYVDKFTTLRQEMDSGNLTQEEFNKKKSELEKLQEELIEKYGDEAKSINLVTGEIKEQTKAIEELQNTNYQKYLQENQKEVNKLAKNMEKEITRTFDFTDFFGNSNIGKEVTNQIKNIVSEIKNVGIPTGATVEDATWVGIKGNPEEVLTAYREIFDKITEYKNENADNLTEADKKYLEKLLEDTSTTISKLNDKYSESIEKYQEYLNNKLQYDEYYKNEYGKILEARAKAEEAINKKDPKELEEAQEEIQRAYENAIEKAGSDPSTSQGMVRLLKEQLDQVNEEIAKEKIGFKIGVQGDEVFNSIQEILNKMGDISLQDLKDGFDTGEITSQMQELKDILDASGISVDDFTKYFEYLGFTFDDVAAKTQETTGSLDALNKNVSNSVEYLANLESGFNTVYSAMDEFNQNGYISASTLQNLINNDLLQYFDVVNGKLTVNEAAMVNAATAAKAKAIEDLQAQAAAEIAAIAFQQEENATSGAAAAAGNTNNKIAALTSALMKMTPETLRATDAWQQLNKALGNSMDGLSEDSVKKIQGIMSNLSKSITTVNATKIESVSYKRYSGGGGSRSSGGRSGSSSSNAAQQAQREAERAAEAAKKAEEQAKKEAEKAAEAARKAEEEAYKKRLKEFEDYVSEKERLEKRWVDKQKDLGQLSTQDYLYITQQRIERYKKYLQELQKATWMHEEDRLKLQKTYTEKIEDLQTDYFKYLKDKMDDEIDKLKENNSKKIEQIKDEADARIDALRKVEKENDRIRDKEEYEKNRAKHLDDISYWEQRTGREAQQSLKEAKENLKELDEQWEQQMEDWSIDDQIEAIEKERDTQVKAIEDAQEAEIASMKAVYDEKVKAFAETGKIIYDGSVMQSKALYDAYKSNFIDPIQDELRKINTVVTKPASQTVSQPVSNPAPAQPKYETYVIQWGDTLTKIARRYGTTIQKIMDANPYVTNKNKIYAGKTLQIPKFHEGGEVGGNKEGFALLKPNEVVLKPEWAAGINKLAKMAKDNNQITNTSNVIEVKGDLVKIQANVKNKTDADYLTKQVEKILKDKFNIKK